MGNGVCISPSCVNKDTLIVKELIAMLWRNLRTDGGVSMLIRKVTAGTSAWTG